MCGVQLHQLREICNARIDGRSLFDVAGGRITDGVSGQVLAHSHLAGIELHIIGGVDLAQHADGTAGIDLDVGSPVLDVFQFSIPVIPCIKIVPQDFIGSLIRILKVLGQGRSHDIEGSCIDNAALADGHALGAQEEEIAADRAVPDGIDRAVDVDARVDEVQEIHGIGIDCLALLVEVQIGDIIGIQLEFREFIDGNIAVEFLGIDVVDATFRRYRLVIDVSDLRSIHRRGAHHESCCHQGREDLIGQLIRFGAGHAGRILGACALILSIRITCITHDDCLLLDGLAVRTGC